MSTYRYSYWLCVVYVDHLKNILSAFYPYNESQWGPKQTKYNFNFFLCILQKKESFAVLEQQNIFEV